MLDDFGRRVFNNCNEVYPCNQGSLMTESHYLYFTTTSNISILLATIATSQQSFLIAAGRRVVIFLDGIARQTRNLEQLPM